MLKEKILSQIEDVKNKTLFDALHCKGHALDKHILTDEELRQALWMKPRPVDVDDIVMVTRFCNEEIAREAIAIALQKNIKEIEKWLLSSAEADYVATATFEDAIGDGLAKNADWNKTIPIHGIRVVIRKDFSCICNSFVVVTAYPCRTLDDVDVIYEAIDDFLAKKA